MKKIKFKIVDGGVCAPKGFFAAGVSAGIKKSNKTDLALIFSSVPASAAGVFTTNKVKAAPVILSLKALKKGRSQAIVINSGNANACVGPKGMEDAKSMAKHAADSLRLDEKDVLVASTGIIGVPMPMKKIVSGIWTVSRMVNSSGSSNAAEAILTTDLRKKEIAIEIPMGGKKIKIGGIAKGSGMICPNMATMIGVLTTDARIGPGLLKKALNEAVSCSFNMITVDNDMSTNDTVFILANGQSENLSAGPKYGAFTEGLKYVCTYLAKEIARDGEGATKLFPLRSGTRERPKMQGLRQREWQALLFSNARYSERTRISGELLRPRVIRAPDWTRIRSMFLSRMSSL